MHDMNTQELTKLLRLHSMLLRREDRTVLKWRICGHGGYRVMLELDDDIYIREEWSICDIMVESGLLTLRVGLPIGSSKCIHIPLFNIDDFIHEQLTLEEVTEWDT